MKTFKINFLLSLLIIVLAMTQKPLKAEIEDNIIKIKLSYKIILNPANGKRPKLEKYFQLKGPELYFELGNDLLFVPYIGVASSFYKEDPPVYIDK